LAVLKSCGNKHAGTENTAVLLTSLASGNLASPFFLTITKSL
jgi:hypothetical protein